MVMKSKNAVIKNLPSIQMAIITQKFFGGHGTGVPPAALLKPVLAWHPKPPTHPPKSVGKQNTDPKGSFLGESIQMPSLDHE